MEDIHKQIADAYWTSNPAQIAFTTIFNEVLSGGLVDESGEPADRKYTIFLRDILLNLNLYGYAVYRRGPEVASGDVTLNYDRKRKIWKPHALEGTDEHGTSGWRVIIAAPPRRDRHHPDSAGFRALRYCNMLINLTDNIMERDRHNSTPAVFTTVSKSLQIGAQGKPWFQSSERDHNTMLGAHSGAVDFNQLVQDRLETLEQLDGLSEQARMHALRKNRPPGVMAKQVQGPEPRIMDHKEHIVSDGRDLAQAPYLRGPEDIRFNMDQLQYAIMYAYGVPPQVLGKNVNSERLSGSARIQEIAIAAFEKMCIMQRDLAQLAFDKLKLDIKFKRCWAPQTVDKLAPLLKPSKLIKLYSCAYDLPESSFRPNPIIMQDTQRRPKTIDEQAKLAEKKAKEPPPAPV